MKTALIGALALLLIIAAAALFYRYSNNEEVPAKESEIPAEEEKTPEELVAETNGRIESILAGFTEIAESSAVPTENLCIGGFVNNMHAAFLPTITGIPANRILNFDPLQYANTQDEAGITCLSDEDQWVLFVPLNTLPGNETPDYRCIDSTGKTGKFPLDRDTIACGA